MTAALRAGLDEWERDLLGLNYDEHTSARELALLDGDLPDDVYHSTSAFDRAPITTEREARREGLHLVVDEPAPVYLDETRRMVGVPVLRDGDDLDTYLIGRIGHFETLAAGMADQPDLAASFRMVVDELHAVKEFRS